MVMCKPENSCFVGISSAGPLLLGYLFNWGLYGVLSVQVYLYYLAFPKDRLPTKCLVLGLYLVETLQTILVTHDAFTTFARDFGDLPSLNVAQLEGLSTPMLSGIVSCTVQLFFTYRIYLLSKSKLLASVLCLIALMQGSAGIATGVKTLQIDDWTKIQLEAFVSCTVWLVGAAVCDIMIAISMVYYLSRSDTGFSSTHVLISRLIRLTIETGSMTAIVATIDIALFLGFPHNNYHTTPALLLAKLYSNTLIVTFNSRLRITGGRGATTSYELNSWSDGGSRSKGVRRPDQSQSSRRQIEVSVDVSKSGWNETETYHNPLESIKVAPLADDSTERRADRMV
ncbi:hypothetical protein BD779DRAFT_1629596 [Infundibulicybe gibba]|nr:hypothetical protein BD779DRAFT_1629596 [Infundibulicybe gibba]